MHNVEVCCSKRAFWCIFGSEGRHQRNTGKAGVHKSERARWKPLIGDG